MLIKILNVLRNKQITTEINIKNFKVLNKQFQNFNQAMCYCDKRLISYYHITKV